MTTHLAKWPWRKTRCGQDLTNGFEESVDRTDIYGPHLPPPYCDDCEGVEALILLAHVNLDGADEPKCMDCGRTANWYIEGQPGSTGWSCGKDDCWKYRK